MALTLRTSGNGVHLSNLPPPRQTLADFKLSERLSMSYETKEEGGVRRAYFAMGDERIALEVAKGNRSETEIAGHKLVIDGGELFIDNRRFDFGRHGFVPAKTAREPGPPTPEQQLANLKQRFPDAKFIGDGSTLSSVVIGNDVKIEGTVHLKPGLQIVDGAHIGPQGVVKGGIISGGLVQGLVSGGQVTDSTIHAEAKVSGGSLLRMSLKKGASVSGGDLRDFSLGEGQTISGGKHHRARQVDTEKLRSAGGVLRSVDRSTANAALEALRLGLDEAERFKPENPREATVKREVKGRLSKSVAKAEALLAKLESAKTSGEVSAAMSELDQVAKSGADAMARLRKLQSTATTRESAPASKGLGIDPEVFRKYVESTLLQLGPLPNAQPVAPGGPSYSEALNQMNLADLLRAYQPQQTGYVPQQLQNFGQFQMPPYLFGGAPPMMTTVPQQFPQQPSGWGKAALLGGAGLLLGMGLGSFGMSTFGLGMGMLPMMGMGMGGMGMFGMGGMGMFPGMGMFGF